MRRPFRRKRLDRWLDGTLDEAALLGVGDEGRDELVFEAKRRLDAGEIEDAKRLFLLAASLSPGKADPRIGLGACAQAMGDLALAIGHYRAAIALERGHPFARMNLAECLLIAGAPRAAREVLEGIITREWRASFSPDARKRLDDLGRLAAEGCVAGTAEGPADAVVYAVEPGLPEAEFRSVLERSTLAERRPVAVPGALAGMLAGAGLIVTARLGDLLIGVSRALTDSQFCTYLSDLAVDRDFQRRGIGRELIRRTHEAAGRNTTLVLLAAPAACEYYPHVGMTAHDSCWIIPRIPPS